MPQHISSPIQSMKSELLALDSYIYLSSLQYIKQYSVHQAVCGKMILISIYYLNPTNNETATITNKDINKRHYAGHAIMANNYSVFFIMFLVFDMIGIYLFLSFCLIILLIEKFPLHLELTLSLLALYMINHTRMVAIAPRIYIN